MAIAFVAGRSDRLGFNNTGTTTAIDTTAATLLILQLSWYYGVTANATFTDSEGNTWTALTKFSTDAFSVRMYYCLNPITSASHTWTGGGESTTLATIQILGFSGCDGSSYDQESGASSGAAFVFSIQPGSITPAQANQVFITAETNAAGATTLPSGWGGASFDFNPGVDVGCGIAYTIQSGGASAENPTWTFATDGAAAAVMATFKEGAPGGGFLLVKN